MRAHLLKDKDKNPFVPITHVDAVVDSNNTSVSLLLNESEQRLQAVKVKTDILITNGDGDLFLANDGTYKKASSGSTKETLVISLINNLNNPSMLIGASVEVLDSNENLLHRSIWDGLDIQVVIDAGIDYTITVGQVQEFATPEPLSYTATLGATRLVKFQYDATAITVNLVNDSQESLNGTATVSYDRYSYEISNGLTVYVPYGKEITITPTDIENYQSPEIQTFVANSVNKTCTLIYKEGYLIVNMLSNQSENILPIAIVSYGDNLVELLNGQSLSIPAGTLVTITFQNIENYKTPDPITFVYNGSIVEKLGTYLAEKVVVNVTATDNLSMDGLIVSVSNGKTYSVINGKVEFLVAHGSSYTVSINSKENYKTPESQTNFANLTNRTIDMQYLYHPYTDLSLQDIYGNPITRNTANCYVVKEPGKYAIPLVYGNAIKDGEINSDAYTNNGGANSSDFVSHNGKVINTPYIETLEGTASSALLSISDTDGIFTDISIIDGSPCRYLQFKVASVPTTGANGVLSIKNSSGVIMWSWHIWVWADSLATVEITNTTSVKYKILPVNLASKWDDIAKTKIKNWFYQFGRPNPMLCPSAYNSNSNHAKFGASSYINSSTASDIQTGIKYPTTFYAYNSSNNYNWFQTNSDKTYNLWDAACTSIGTSDNNTIKTVYDPCPVGFKIPNGNTFTGFSNVIGSFNNGYKFNRYPGDTVGIFFPASGQREGGSGSSPSYVGSNGYIWVSSNNSLNYAHFLYFNSNGINVLNLSYRAYGLSIRPVLDVALSIPVHKLIINLVNGTKCTIKQVSVAEDGTITEGSVIATQNTATATHNIPWGTTYKIFLEDVEGHTKPETLVYIANVLEREVTLTYIPSTLTVNIASNQANDSAIEGWKATVTYGSSTILVSSGQTISIPINTLVTIKFPSLINYKTPSDITFVHTGGAITKTGTYQTEVVSVVLITDNGVSASGLIVTINGVNYSFSGGAVSTKIPYGTTYSISVNDMVGYAKPDSVSYTASQVSRSVTMTYKEVIKGVFIATSAGTLVNPDSWTSSSGTAVGVAVITDNVSFIIDKEYKDAYKENISWGTSSYDSLLTDCDTEHKAQEDYNGLSNTDILISELGSDISYPAGYVRSKTISYGGITKIGYLGSAGEWQAVIDNYEVVQNALTKIGGFEILWNYNSTSYYTSTEFNSGSIWMAKFAYSFQELDRAYKSAYSQYQLDNCVTAFYKL